MKTITYDKFIAGFKNKDFTLRTKGNLVSICEDKNEFILMWVENEEECTVYAKYKDNLTMNVVKNTIEIKPKYENDFLILEAFVENKYNF